VLSKTENGWVCDEGDDSSELMAGWLSMMVYLLPLVDRQRSKKSQLSRTGSVERINESSEDRL
jgi:hypothetical protein